MLDGYGFSEDTKVEFIGEINGTEVDWTIGALYARLVKEGRIGHGSAQGDQMETLSPLAASEVAPVSSGKLIALLFLVGACLYLIRLLRRPRRRLDMRLSGKRSSSDDDRDDEVAGDLEAIFEK